MRLLTHNHLKCSAKDVAHGFPLNIEIEDMEIVESEFNVEFIVSILPQLSWEAILVACKATGIDGFPSEYKPELLNDQEFLQAVHNLLLDVHINKGFLVCPESGRKFPIENGIPNMM